MKILVADHTGALAPTCIIFLAYWGHEVEVVPDGPAALRKARAWRPDLVLAPIGLDRIDGLSLLSTLRASGSLPRTAFVLTCPGNDDHARRRSQALGASAYLGTPLAVADLARVVQRIEEASAVLSVERSRGAWPADSHGERGRADDDLYSSAIRSGLFASRR